MRLAFDPNISPFQGLQPNSFYNLLQDQKFLNSNDDNFMRQQMTSTCASYQGNEIRSLPQNSNYQQQTYSTPKHIQSQRNNLHSLSSVDKEYSNTNTDLSPYCNSISLSGRKNNYNHNMNNNNIETVDQIFVNNQQQNGVKNCYDEISLKGDDDNKSQYQYNNHQQYNIPSISQQQYYSFNSASAQLQYQEREQFQQYQSQPQKQLSLQEQQQQQLQLQQQYQQQLLDQYSQLKYQTQQEQCVQYPLQTQQQQIQHHQMLLQQKKQILFSQQQNNLLQQQYQQQQDMGIEKQKELKEQKENQMNIRNQKQPSNLELNKKLASIGSKIKQISMQNQQNSKYTQNNNNNSTRQQASEISSSTSSNFVNSSNSSSSDSRSNKQSYCQANSNKNRKRNKQANKELEEAITSQGQNLIKEVLLSRKLKELFVLAVGTTEYFRKIIIQQKYSEALLLLLKLVLQLIATTQKQESKTGNSSYRRQDPSQWNSEQINAISPPQPLSHRDTISAISEFKINTGFLSHRQPLLYNYHQDKYLSDERRRIETEIFEMNKYKQKTPSMKQQNNLTNYQKEEPKKNLQAKERAMMEKLNVSSNNFNTNNSKQFSNISDLNSLLLKKIQEVDNHSNMNLNNLSIVNREDKCLSNHHNVIFSQQSEGTTIEEDQEYTDNEQFQLLNHNKHSSMLYVDLPDNRQSQKANFESFNISSNVLSHSPQQPSDFHKDSKYFIFQQIFLQYYQKGSSPHFRNDDSQEPKQKIKQKEPRQHEISSARNISQQFEKTNASLNNKPKLKISKFEESTPKTKQIEKPSPNARNSQKNRNSNSNTSNQPINNTPKSIVLIDTSRLSNTSFSAHSGNGSSSTKAQVGLMPCMKAKIKADDNKNKQISNSNIQRKLKMDSVDKVSENSNVINLQNQSVSSYSTLPTNLEVERNKRNK